MRRAARGLIRWALLGALYLGLALILLHPLASRFTTHSLGYSNDDLYDEMFLLNCVLEGIQTEASVFSSPNLEFPLEQGLIYSHKSYLHTLFSVPLLWLLPWPQWWNASLLLAVVSAALGLAWAVERVSGARHLGALAGVSMLGMPWVLAMVDWGHLPQLWSAPMFLAAASLHRTLRAPEDRWAPALLAVFTVITSLIYWIWGLLLAWVGGLMVGMELRRLGPTRRRRLGLAALPTLATLLPLAFLVLSADPFLPRWSVGGGLSPEIRADSLQRAAGLSLLPAITEAPRPSPWATQIPLWLGLATLILAGLGARTGNAALQWLTAGWTLLVLAAGPYLSWGGRFVTDPSGRPVPLPFLHLVHLTGVGYAWRTPDTALPLAVCCLFLAAAAHSATPGGRRTLQGLLIALGLWSLALWVPFGLYGRDRHPVRMEPARVPAFVEVLRAQPRGAVLELPMGACLNAWHLQPLHRQPSTHGKRPLPNLVRNNDFARHLYELNALLLEACGLPPPVTLGPEGSELPYGERALPVDRFPRRPLPQPPAATPDPSAIRAGYLQATRQGIRYAVLHRAHCDWISPAAGARFHRAYRAWLGEAFGHPIFEDQEATIFALPDETGPLPLPEALPSGP